MTKRSQRANGIIAVLGDRPVAYHPAFAGPLGGVREALFVCQLLYWDGKGRSSGGWIYKTQAEWTEETGLSRYEQETVRKHLRQKGVLEENRRGVPARLYYRLNFDVLRELVEEAYPEDEPGEQPQDAATPHTSLQQHRILACSNPAGIGCSDPTDQNAANPPTITETTSQSTRDGQTERASVDCAQIWSQVFQEIELQMTKATFDTWVRPVHLVAVDAEAGAAVIETPNQYVKDWLDNRLDVVVRRTLAGVIGIPMDQLTITYSVTGDVSIEPEPPVPRAHLASELEPTTVAHEQACMAF